ncbi:MAG: ATP synthase F1 subunit delta [Patescibacteria group bacterium]
MSKLLPAQYAKILFNLTKDAKKDDLEDVIKNFFSFLKKEHVLKKADYIIKEFIKFSKKQEGIQEIEIISSAKISNEKIKEISKLFGEKTEVKTEIEPDIIGGLIIETDDTILDASVKTQLNKLKQHLL